MEIRKSIAEHQALQRQKIQDSFEKGIYTNNSENRKKGRVGQHYGGEEKKEEVKKDTSNPDNLSAKEVLHEAFSKGGAYEGQDTLDIYSSGGYYNPTWTPERAKLHDGLVDKYLKTGSKQKGGQTVSVMMGGAPASGKSSVIKAGLMDIPDGLIQIDADAMKAELPEYKEAVKAHNAAGAPFAHEESSYLTKKVLREGTQKGFGVLVDGTGNTSIESVKKKVKSIRDAGHRVVANYVTLDVELALSNNLARYKKTGRLVPEKYVRGVSRNIPNIIESAIKQNVFDELHLFDTNINGKPRKILDMVDGELTIHDQKLYETFLKQKGE